LQETEQWRALRLRQRGQRGAEEESEDGDLEDLIFGNGLGDVFREDVEQNLLPGLWLGDGRWARRLA
jgi:hypothetical protein